MAVGGNKFINDILSQMGFRANGRKIIEKGQTLQISEEIQSYNPLFESQNGIIAPKIPWFGNNTHMNKGYSLVRPEKIQATPGKEGQFLQDVLSIINSDVGELD